MSLAQNGDERQCQTIRMTSEDKDKENDNKPNKVTRTTDDYD